MRQRSTGPGDATVLHTYICPFSVDCSTGGGWAQQQAAASAMMLPAPQKWVVVVMAPEK